MLSNRKVPVGCPRTQRSRLHLRLESTYVSHVSLRDSRCRRVRKYLCLRVVDESRHDLTDTCTSFTPWRRRSIRRFELSALSAAFAALYAERGLAIGTR